MITETATPTRPAQHNLDDLAEIISAYNQVTEKLQLSHDALQGEVARLREELASTNAQLQRSKRLSALGEMAAGIAHEIRNPLAAIQLYAGMAIDDVKAGDAHEACDSLHKIASAVRGLSAIVNDVLSFARQISPSVQPVAAMAMLQRVIDAHRPAIDAAAVRVEVEVDEGMVFDADPQLLHQALLNLVRNAVDAMAQSSPGLREVPGEGDGLHGPRTAARLLALSARRDADRGIFIRVADTGPGIDPEHIDRIFNPFYTTRNTGTGLGLAIVHRIVDAHGGAISVWNDADNGGAVFELNLQSLICDLQSDEDAELQDRLQIADCRSEIA